MGGLTPKELLLVECYHKHRGDKKKIAEEMGYSYSTVLNYLNRKTIKEHLKETINDSISVEADVNSIEELLDTKDNDNLKKEVIEKARKAPTLEWIILELSKLYEQIPDIPNITLAIDEAVKTYMVDGEIKPEELSAIVCAKIDANIKIQKEIQAMKLRTMNAIKDYNTKFGEVVNNETIKYLTMDTHSLLDEADKVLVDIRSLKKDLDKWSRYKNN